MFIFKNFKKQNSEQSLNSANNTINNNNGQSSNRQRNNVVGGFKPMDQYLQKKFSRGIQYNMKIIIRGDRNVGKTCLFYRLQGDKFHEEYLASEEIKVASIQWNYNATDDIIKVEIWDIVDKGKKRENLLSQNVTKNSKNSSSATTTKDVLKLMHNNQRDIRDNHTNQRENSIDDDSINTSTTPALDAEFVDVYKGTNGVIFLFDMTKAWTFDYIQREIHKCPLNIPILILANHRDMGHHRVITSGQVYGFIDNVLKEDVDYNRKRIGQIRYAECSMRNGFGLRYLYKFFNLPYLHLQRETMLKQLERNHSEIDATCQELDAMIDSDEYNYDNFLEMLTNKRRMIADQLSATKNVEQRINNNNNNNINHNDKIPSRSVSMPSNMSKILNGDVNQNNETIINKPMPSIIIGANNPLPPKFQQQFQKNNHNDNKNLKSSTRNNNVSVKNIEDFIPDDGEQNIFRKFLDEPNLYQTDLPPVIDEENSCDDNDDDDDGNNQLVAKYQEELDPEDLILNESQNNNDKNFEKIESTTFKQIENNDNLNSIENTDKLFETTNGNDVYVDLDDQQNQSSINVLNIDEIEALENMYISKHSIHQNESNNNVDDNNHSSQSSTINDHNQTNETTKKSTNKKKKKSTLKTMNDEPNAQQEIITTNKKKKSSKTKAKNSTKLIPNNNADDDDDDDDRKRLEEFLGPSMDNDTSLRDHDSYLMF